MKQILVVIVLLSFLLESCIVTNSTSFIIPLTKKEKRKSYYSIQIHKDYRKFFIPPFFICDFDKKNGLYFLEYDFYNEDNILYTELRTIEYVFYDEVGREFSSGNFNLNGKIEMQILTGNESLKIPTDTLYRILDRTIPQIMIPDSIKRITADFTLYLRRVDGNIDSLDIKEEYELDRRKGVYSFF